MTESLSDKPLTGQKGVREKNDEVLAESATLPLSDYGRVARDPTRIADWTCRIPGKHYPTGDVAPIECFQRVLRLSYRGLVGLRKETYVIFLKEDPRQECYRGACRDFLSPPRCRLEQHRNQAAERIERLSFRRAG